MRLHIDIETYSEVDLKKSGVYCYVNHPSFEILLFACAYDDQPIVIIDLTKEKLPDYLIADIKDPAITKVAFNANFERVCLSRHLDERLTPDQWECTMVRAASAGLPLSLAQVAEVLKLDVQKMTEGRALIRFFCNPCTPTKLNNHRTRNLPRHAPDKWITFKKYCIKDVEVEMAIDEQLSWYTPTDSERQLYILDQDINDLGVMVDKELAQNAIEIDANYKEGLAEEASSITALDNPNSVQQLKAWIAEETGEDVDSLTKESIKELLKTLPSEEVTRMLRIRQEMAKTSVKKYQAMMDALGHDDRIRGLLQFYGASRTGRWAGRLVQVQNLPQNHLTDLDLARQLVKENDADMLETLFGNVPDTLSQLIRTAFIPRPGHTFMVADFSAIEARIIAWLADERWRLEVFATHGKIYEASASQMFRVPIASVTKGSDLRAKGKISELALGYGGGVGALEKMGAAKMGLHRSELPGLVDAWREANPAIVKLWSTVEKAAIAAIRGTRTTIAHNVTFEMQYNSLLITLPSGRALCYRNARIGAGRFGEAIMYEGMNQTTKKWEETETYGGKLVENIVQSIARDCLADSMLRLARWHYYICMHIHDEVVIEAPVDDADLNLVTALMGSPITWAPGLLLRADGYITPYYRKD